MKKKFIFITTAILLTGCATSYGERGFFGDGYSDVRLKPDTFLVTFKGNGYTSSDTVEQYVLLRASELTLKNGYKYFAILSSEDKTSRSEYVTSSTDVSKGTDVHARSKRLSERSYETESTTVTSGTIVRPGTSIRIQCFVEQPREGDVIDAAFYWRANNPYTDN